MADTPVNSSNVGAEDEDVAYAPRDPSQEGAQTQGADSAVQGYTTDLGLKHQAVAGAQSYADTLANLAKNRAGYESQIGSSYDAATKAGLGQLQQRGGQALASVAGNNSAANYGAVLAAGQQQGINEAAYEGQQGLAKTAAMQQAHESALDAEAQAAGAKQAALEYQYKAGSDEKERQALRGAADAKLSEIIKNNKGTLHDDVSTMAIQIRNYAATVGDPLVRDELLKRADAIESGVEDV